MDPVTLVFTALGVIVGVKILWKPVFYGSISLVQNIKKKINKRKSRGKKAQKKLKEDYELLKELKPEMAISFTNARTKKVTTINAREELSFDFSKNDRMFAGRVIIYDVDKRPIFDKPIYVYQPRLESLNGIPLGPVYDVRGNLSEKAPYLVKDANTGDKMYASLPKRELLSGIPFDFVNDSVFQENSALNEFIDVVIPKDEHGNFIPVDFSKEEERNKFKQYMDTFRHDYSKVASYYISLLDRAQESLEQYRERTKPNYARPLATESSNIVHRIEESRKPKNNPYRFLNEQYNYWRPFGLPPRDPYNRPQPRGSHGPRGPRH